MSGRGVRNLDLLECVWTYMITSLEQVDITYMLTYVNPITTNQKPTIDTQKQKRTLLMKNLRL